MSTHHGFLEEFPFIRVDAFHGDPAKVNPYTGNAPHFYLLTHAHTDHINGLNSPQFQGRIYATAMTKQLVLGTIETADRVRYAELSGTIKRRYKFLNLRKAGPRGKGSAGDRIQTIPLNTPVQIGAPDGSEVTVIALDANHCPGSCMYLIDGIVAGQPKAVLITGDIRIEPHVLEALKHNPLVQPYLPRLVFPRGPGAPSEDERTETRKVLDRIYLDTSQIAQEDEYVTKEEACAGLVELMAQYPKDTRFFINAWTPGYEDILKVLYKTFGERIHVDWYKYGHYTSEAFRAGEPLLAELCTSSAFPTAASTSSTTVNPSPSLHAGPPAASTSSAPPPPTPLRFHACERRWKCDHVWQDGLGCYEWDDDHVPLLHGPKKLKRPGSGEVLSREEGAEGRVVYVNPCEMPRWRWDAYRAETMDRFRKGSALPEEQRARSAQGLRQKAGWKGKRRARDEDGEDEVVDLPNSLICPLARHSCRPELQAFVALFRPQSLYPLTCTDDDPVSPAHQYQLLPKHFGSLLAPGGREQLEREAQAYVKQACKRCKLRAAVDPSSAGRTQLEDEGDGLREPAWLREMNSSKKGMNIEGGWDVLDEVCAWVLRLEKGQRSPSVVPKKRPRPPTDVVELTDTDDDAASAEAAHDGPSAYMPSSSSDVPHGRPAKRVARQLSYGASNGALGLQLKPPAEPQLPPYDFKSLPSPFLEAAPPNDETPEVAQHRSSAPLTVPTHRKSVTFNTPLHSEGRVPPIAKGSRVQLLPSFQSSTSTPFVAPLATTSAYDSSSSAFSPLAPTVAPAPTASTAVAGPVTHPSPTTAPYRRRMIAALHRSLRGLIGSDGRIEPFKPGDPRLQGRRALGKENDDERERPSPTSFQTVSASTSPLQP
ncbi:uncharacterized protein JCM10292_005116 [Rhodotorula paludigena]|uniref:uncharacterized protein n=1 Tax=Rhodotorula paludigena TaxID=86838 RepID=UPI0031760B9C